MKVYFISGLGADKRAFGKIALPDSFEIVHLGWVSHVPGESLGQYAVRMAEKIDDSSPFILIGLSFGGLVATEINKIKPARRLVLISSMGSNRELPLAFRAGRLLGLHRMLPFNHPKRFGRLLKKAFGPLDADGEILLTQILADTDPVFAKWAIGEVLQWKQEKRPAGLLQIHGSRDRIFCSPPAREAIIMSGGGHFCVYSHAKIISSLLAHNL